MTFINRWIVLASFVAVCAAGILTSKAASATHVLRWVSDPAEPRKMVVELNGLTSAELKSIRKLDQYSSDWGRGWLSVFAEQGDAKADKNLPPMLGTYVLESSTLRFIPRFPLEPGVHYRAVFHSHAGIFSGTLSSDFACPAREPHPATVVSVVYPTADILPENLLKFYLHFSGPMSGGHCYDYIHLLHENGAEVDYPFLRLDEELWDPAMTRLTLFIDPGRIKRGVQPNIVLGPSITEGKRFTLVLDSAWKDATGMPLKQTFRKTFQAGPPDRKPMDIGAWKIHPPKAGSRDPITIIFPKPMDHALALRVIRVMTKAGAGIEGEATLEEHERRWQFIPRDVWPQASHNLVIQTTLEDLAGNNIGKAFEVDVFEDIDRQLSIRP